MTDIETLKTFNPKNLSEGKRQAEEEKLTMKHQKLRKLILLLLTKRIRKDYKNNK